MIRIRWGDDLKVYLPWQRDGNGRPLPRVAGQVDTTTHEVEVSFDDAETESGTGDARSIGGPEEGFEKVFLFFGWNTDTPVPDPDIDRRRLIRQRAVDGGGFGRIFDGVGQDVIEDISQELDIHLDRPGGSFGPQFDVLTFFEGVFHVLDRFPGKVDKIGFDGTVLDDTYFELFEGQEVVKDLFEVVDIGFDAVDVFEALVLLVGLGIFFDQGDRRKDYAKRGLKLMGGQSDETGF
jgi:hypothetical protein